MALVQAFVRQHFSWRGALRMHRAVLGRDLLRAPRKWRIRIDHFTRARVESIASLARWMRSLAGPSAALTVSPDGIFDRSSQTRSIGVLPPSAL
jgi:hypothetical protein